FPYTTLFRSNSGQRQHGQKTCMATGTQLLVAECKCSYHCRLRRPASRDCYGGRVHQSTQHSNTQLSPLWSAAQQTLSQQVDLNPLEREFYNVAPNILPGDARVWRGSPRQIQVESQADVSLPVLQQATGMVRPDPTGLIACPQPCSMRQHIRIMRSQPRVTRRHGNRQKVISTLLCNMNLKTRYCIRSAMTPPGGERRIAL